MKWLLFFTSLPIQEEGWVVCRAFKKRTNGQDNKSIEGFDPGYLYDEPSGMSSVIDPTNIEYIPRHEPHNFSPANLFACKHEIEGDSLSFIGNLNAELFLQLPQLESPSLSLMKRPIISVCEEESDARYSSLSNKRSVTDWRALDKFVASQLSQEDRYSNNNGGEDGDNNNNNNNTTNDFTGSFSGGNGSSNSPGQMALLLLHGGGREERNVNNSSSLMSGFWSSEADRDIGICIFEK